MTHIIKKIKVTYMCLKCGNTFQREYITDRNGAVQLEDNFHCGLCGTLEKMDIAQVDKHGKEGS